MVSLVESFDVPTHAAAGLPAPGAILLDVLVVALEPSRNRRALAVGRLKANMVRLLAEVRIDMARTSPRDSRITPAHPNIQTKGARPLNQRLRLSSCEAPPPLLGFERSAFA